ncbi:uncharacterized protein STEHIDRAFT_111814 [Stereum hirsutum FP-91666 SS1]|uniref:uncharacterized protein n=1 Tax=Stereum hirsutum (strain FP-91666) TaxID=721885 RepID=UPI0004449DF9|nr:uncharacterized protein STEHIDRAFT_111814 [Stereum hirsutum FP-91666 SS1]EIM86336.1 hypothetical protein STEHIDRAFT_111814 [Stereum hirsutum FP-91666 SS1]
MVISQTRPPSQMRKHEQNAVTLSYRYLGLLSSRQPFPLLRGYLAYLEHPCLNGKPYIQYVERSELEKESYPFPNVTLHELRDHPHGIHSVEWTLYKILSRGGGNGGIDPLEADGSWTFDSILLDMCHQIETCDIEIAARVDTCSRSGPSLPASADFICRLRANGVAPSLGAKVDSMPILFAATRVEELPEFPCITTSAIESIDPATFSRGHQPLLDIAVLFQSTLNIFIKSMKDSDDAARVMAFSLDTVGPPQICVNGTCAAAKFGEITLYSKSGLRTAVSDLYFNCLSYNGTFWKSQKP